MARRSRSRLREDEIDMTSPSSKFLMGIMVITPFAVIGALMVAFSVEQIVAAISIILFIYFTGSITTRFLYEE